MRLSLMNCAIGLPLTKVVSTFTGRPRYDATLATFVSALVACMIRDPAQCTGCPWGAAIRIPILEGTTMAYLQFFLSSIFN